MVRNDSLCRFEEGAIPATHEAMNIYELIGIANAVVELWPSVVVALHTLLSDSICSQTLGFVKSESVSWTSTRTLYFGVIQNFIHSTDEAKRIRLTSFLTKTKYKTSESPLAFATKLLKEQKELNILFNTNAVAEPILREIFINAVKGETGRMYDHLLDSIDGTGLNFLEIATKLNNKYQKEATKSITHSLYSAQIVNANDGDDGANPMTSTAFYSGSSHKSEPAGSRKDLQCFQFRDTGKCSFGKDCKFSHDKRTFKDKVSTQDAIYQARLIKAHETEKILVVQNRATKYKKLYNSKKSKSKSNSSNGSKGFTKHYEDAGNSSKSPKPTFSKREKANMAKYEASLKSGMDSGNQSDNDSEGAEGVEISANDSSDAPQSDSESS